MLFCGCKHLHTIVDSEVESENLLSDKLSQKSAMTWVPESSNRSVSLFY